ncbi:MAG: hypothetical protein K6346_06985 [Halothiobacillaceae bacterium]
MLSECALGEVNTRASRRALLRNRPLPTLGDLTLGDVAEVKWRTLTEMHIAVLGFTDGVPYGFEATPSSLHRLLTRASERNTEALAAPLCIAVASHRTGWQGQTWTDARWPALSWIDTRELIGSAHSAG